MKKLKLNQPLRILSLLAFSILMPGMFVLFFGQIKNVYVSLISGNFNFVQISQYSLGLVVVVVSTVLLGRFFCGYMCAFGLLNDAVYYISKRLFKHSFKLSVNIDSVLKYAKYAILLFIVAVIWTVKSTFLSSSSPWDAFAQLPDFTTIYSDYLIGLFILFAIIIGAGFIERFFCRYLCPLGAVLNILSLVRIFKISKPTQNCGSCRLCTDNCAMGIKLFKYEKVHSGECINCFKCTDVCPKKNVHASVFNQEVNPSFVSSLAVSAVVGAYSLVNIGTSDINNPNVSVSKTNDVVSTDNTNVTAEVLPTINPASSNNGQDAQNGIVATQKHTPTNSTALPIITPPKSFDTVTNQPIQSSLQITPKPDLSNPTIKSEASQPTIASKATTPSMTQSNTNTPKETTQPTTASKPTESKKYNDGIYTGVGRGYRPNLVVSVTIKNDKINNVEIVSNNETPSYTIEPFKTIPSAIVSSQSTKVNGISGATRTCNGIKQAVEDALSKARA